MKGFTVFITKELRELVRTKRLLILLIVFTVFGIMNPAIALLTPKFIEMEADTFKAMGMEVGEITVTALDAWTQFVKNIPMALIVFLLMMSGIYLTEYTKGTLIPLLTKGLSRSAVVLSKWTVMLLTWSAGCWLIFGITYFYSDYYWDNSAVSNLMFSGFGWWLFGVLLMSCIVFFSSFAGSTAQVILSTGAVYFIMMLLGMVRKLQEYLPTRLCSSASLYSGELEPSDFTKAAVITATASAVLVLAALPLTKKRQL